MSPADTADTGATPGRKISAQDFFEAFTQEWDGLCGQAPVTGRTPFDSRPAWTERMLGNEGFLRRVMDRLVRPDRPLHYKREWYAVDALFVGGADTYRDGLSYPSEVHALIEHEFAEDLETEMWKLLHWRAPLKVIINYDWADSEKSTPQRRAYRSDKMAGLRRMRAQVAAFHPEAPDTEYLFLLACRATPDAPIEWRRA